MAVFESEHPGDPRLRAAIDPAQAFADGARRTKVLRDRAWADPEAHDAAQAAAGEAAGAGMHAAAATVLHPLPRATQVKHILGAAAHASRALELSAGDDPAVGGEQIERARMLAPTVLVALLRRYPLAPPGGGRVGDPVRQLDASLR